jgi:hypothetical protein
MFRAWAICRYFRGRSAAYLVGVLPGYERAICRKRTYVIPLNTTNDERNAQEERSHLAAPLLNGEFFSLVRPGYWGVHLFGDAVFSGR